MTDLLASLSTTVSARCGVLQRAQQPQTSHGDCLLRCHSVASATDGLLLLVVGAVLDQELVRVDAVEHPRQDLLHLALALVTRDRDAVHDLAGPDLDDAQLA